MFGPMAKRFERPRRGPIGVTGSAGIRIEIPPELCHAGAVRSMANRALREETIASFLQVFRCRFPWILFVASAGRNGKVAYGAGKNLLQGGSSAFAPKPRRISTTPYVAAKMTAAKQTSKRIFQRFHLPALSGFRIPLSNNQTPYGRRIFPLEAYPP